MPYGTPFSHRSKDSTPSASSASGLKDPVEVPDLTVKGCQIFLSSRSRIGSARSIASVSSCTTKKPRLPQTTHPISVQASHTSSKETDHAKFERDTSSSESEVWSDTTDGTLDSTSAMWKVKDPHPEKHIRHKATIHRPDGCELVQEPCTLSKHSKIDTRLSLMESKDLSKKREVLPSERKGSGDRKLYPEHSLVMAKNLPEKTNVAPDLTEELDDDFDPVGASKNRASLLKDNLTDDSSFSSEASRSVMSLGERIRMMAQHSRSTDWDDLDDTELASDQRCFEKETFMKMKVQKWISQQDQKPAVTKAKSDSVFSSVQGLQTVQEREENVNDVKDQTSQIKKDDKQQKASALKKLVERLESNRQDDVDEAAVQVEPLFAFTGNLPQGTEVDPGAADDISVEDLHDKPGRDKTSPESSHVDPCDEWQEKSFHNQEIAEEKPLCGTKTAEGQSSSIACKPDVVSQTYMDIMKAITKLEEEEKLSALEEADRKSANESDDKEKKNGEGEEIEMEKTVVTLSPSVTTPEQDSNVWPQEDSEYLKMSTSSTKLGELMTYLDEIETSDHQTLAALKYGTSLESDGEKDELLNLPNFEELTKKTVSELAHQIVALQLQLEVKVQNILTLKETHARQRELNVINVKNCEKDMTTRIKAQKEDYEAVIKRHQNFVDQLMEDKKMLNDRCEKLLTELKSVQKKYQDTLKTMEERHDIELQRVKEIHVAAEKLRREKWIDEKTKQIKEMTVKGLEPEIQKLMAKHVQEVTQLKALHQNELLTAEERINLKYVEQLEEIKRKLLNEKETACMQERELIRQRCEKQLEQEEQEHMEQRRRLQQQLQQEREEFQEVELKMKVEIEQIKLQLEEEAKKEKAKLAETYEEAQKAADRRHQIELRNLRESLEIEKEAWMDTCKKKQEQEMIKKEKEIRELYKKERDKEIEMVIAELQFEATMNKTENDRAFDNRIRRWREKYEGEIRELEMSEKRSRLRFNEAKAKLIEKEEEVSTISTKFSHREAEYAALKKFADNLQEERSNLDEIIRQDYKDKISFLEANITKLNAEIVDLSMQDKLNLEKREEEKVALQKAQEKELAEVHQRVKRAMEKKDDAMSELKKQHDIALKKCRHLEKLMEQQRRDFLLK